MTPRPAPPMAGPMHEHLRARAMEACGVTPDAFRRNLFGCYHREPAHVHGRERLVCWLRHNGLPGALMSYPEIARTIGMKAHSTALMAYARAKTRGWGQPDGHGAKPRSVSNLALPPRQGATGVELVH